MPNLVKQRFIVSDNNQARVINSNIKLEEIYREMNNKREDLQSPPEFEEGLFAERVELTDEYNQLLEDEYDFTNLNENPEPLQEEPIVDTAVVEQMLEEAGQQAEEIVRLAKQEADEIRENAYNEGFLSGEEKAKEQYRQMELQLNYELSQKQEQMEADYNATLEQMEPEIVEIFLGLIKDVLSVELSDYSAVISELVMRTIMHLDNPKKVSIYVSPTNFATVNNNENAIKEQLGNGADLEIIRDDKLTDEQCKIETERGIYDCGFDVQLNNLLKKIKMLSIGSK